MNIYLISVLFVFSESLCCQDSVMKTTGLIEEDRFIRWIAELPSENTIGHTGFFERLFNFIVGSESVVFNNPVNVFADEIDNYWIVNQGNGAIVNYKNGKTSLLPSFRKRETSFPSLVGICNFRGEELLFTDSRLNRAFVLSDGGNQINLFNDSDTLNRPTGIAYSATTEEVWIVETGSHRIAVFDINGERKRTIGGRGNGPLEFNFPTYIWIDKSGRIYIVDSMNFRVQILSPEGEFISSFGQQGDSSGYFARPRGIATDSNGNIYIVDALSNVVQIFDSTGRLLHYFGSQGSGKYQFWMPSGIFIDKSDYIYIADSYNGRVQIFQLVKSNQQ